MGKKRNTLERLIIVPIERLEERYSDQWWRWLEESLHAYGVKKYEFVGDHGMKTIKEGQFLENKKKSYKRYDCLSYDFYLSLQELNIIAFSLFFYSCIVLYFFFCNALQLFGIWAIQFEREKGKDYYIRVGILLERKAIYDSRMSY